MQFPILDIAGRMLRDPRQPQISNRIDGASPSDRALCGQIARFELGATTTSQPFHLSQRWGKEETALRGSESARLRSGPGARGHCRMMVIGCRRQFVKATSRRRRHATE